MHDNYKINEVIPVELANGTIIKFETSQKATGPQDVSSLKALPLNGITGAIQEIISDLKETIDKVKPNKASVKFGVEVAVDSGNLTALIVKSAGKGNLEITLEWTK